MKTLALVSAGILLVGILLCAIALFKAPNGFSDVLEWLKEPVYMNKDENGHWQIESGSDTALYDRDYSAKDSVTKLEVEGVDEDIVLIPSETREKVFVSYTEGDGVAYDISEADGCLRIARKGTGEQKLQINFSIHESSRICVEYPADSTLKAVSLVSISGGMQIETAEKLDTLSIDTTSGEIDLKNVEAGDVTLNGISMETEGSLVCDTLAYFATSGEAELTLTANKAAFTAISTDFELKLTGSADEYAVACSGISTDFSMNGEEFAELQEDSTYIFIDGRAVKARDGEAETKPHLFSFSMTSGDVELKTEQ